VFPELAPPGSPLARVPVEDAARLLGWLPAAPPARPAS